ncbi:oxidoreductase-like protein [Anopheles sinensis]|uniref:Oxidoreductase-like protein n=1 Tax=Anopheles sinensis TaxID=74873 RepID=A0A084VRB4_ANOSI|nr:oxidoreductase-like protein [Anopheles sinensis]
MGRSWKMMSVTPPVRWWKPYSRGLHKNATLNDRPASKTWPIAGMANNDELHAPIQGVAQSKAQAQKLSKGKQHRQTSSGPSASAGPFKSSSFTIQGDEQQLTNNVRTNPPCPICGTLHRTHYEPIHYSTHVYCNRVKKGA